ncbi:3'-5' exonuclease family protein [Stenoxybacter acetivorans]|uniref:3'-5' exonuclease family protein n=1 Tax=Stenoxybacter acetivorans TaxID=422441 RepID=UPI000691EF9B|nr:3'-5' exonuclease family protein [Stenoxybacter acetivorans]
MQFENLSDEAWLAPLAQAIAKLPLPVVIVDLETTGGHFENDRITEIAVLCFSGGKIERWQSLINPEQDISPFITRLTGISNEMVAGAPTFSQIAADILPYLQGHIIAAHNSRFDYTFLRNEFARAQLPFAAPTLCTVQLSRKLYPHEHKHSLDSIIERFHLSNEAEDRHRAWADVRVLSRFLNISLTAHGVEHWQAQFRQLIKPTPLPAFVSENIRRHVYNLPDTAGFSVWATADQQLPAVHIHEKAFSEISVLLQKKNTEKNISKIQNIEFFPALNVLHAYQLSAQHQINALSAADNRIDSVWYSIRFVPNHHGQLRAQIYALPKNGILKQRPYGLFAHPKPAKAALREWAREYAVCPAILDILDISIGASAPCPLQAARLCNGRCRNADQTAQHNQRVLKHAPFLPVHNWGTAHEITTMEYNPFSKEQTQLHSAAAALDLGNNQWYFHEALPKLWKKRLNQKDGITVLS